MGYVSDALPRLRLGQATSTLGGVPVLSAQDNQLGKTWQIFADEAEKYKPVLPSPEWIGPAINTANAWWQRHAPGQFPSFEEIAGYVRSAVTWVKLVGQSLPLETAKMFPWAEVNWRANDGRLLAFGRDPTVDWGYVKIWLDQTNPQPPAVPPLPGFGGLTEEGQWVKVWPSLFGIHDFVRSVELTRDLPWLSVPWARLPANLDLAPLFQASPGATPRERAELVSQAIAKALGIPYKPALQVAPYAAATQSAKTLAPYATAPQSAKTMANLPPNLQLANVPGDNGLTFHVPVLTAYKPEYRLQNPVLLRRRPSDRPRTEGERARGGGSSERTRGGGGGSAATDLTIPGGSFSGKTEDQKAAEKKMNYWPWVGGVIVVGGVLYLVMRGNR